HNHPITKSSTLSIRDNLCRDWINLQHQLICSTRSCPQKQWMQCSLTLNAKWPGTIYILSVPAKAGQCRNIARHHFASASVVFSRNPLTEGTTVQYWSAGSAST